MTSRVDDPLAELTRLGQELGDDFVWVCVTHKRYIPCRSRDERHVYSSAPENVEAVRRYQLGLDDAPASP